MLRKARYGHVQHCNLAHTERFSMTSSRPVGRAIIAFEVPMIASARLQDGIDHSHHTTLDRNELPSRQEIYHNVSISDVD